MPSRSRWPTPRALALGALTLCLSSTGCGACRRLAGTDTILLEKAEVKSMSVDIRRAQKTVCPRQPVQMAVFADVVLEGAGAPRACETWQGRGQVNKNDKLDFTEFAFHTEQGTIDRDGWLAPTPDLLLTAGKEIEVKTVYRRRPDKFTFTTSYKPDYACITDGAEGGRAGHAGPSGSDGAAGRSGASSSGSGSGGDGGDGAPGNPGGTGETGGPGPRLVVYATMVKTAFYERLVAIEVEGDRSDLLLAPEGQVVTIHASGGPGGSGGHGGHGGAGGSGGSGNPGGKGGRGSQGGAGGPGGNGGPGGAIQYLYDARFSQLKGLVRLDVAGGGGGPGGGPGQAGSGGSGGSGISPSHVGSGPPPPPARSGAAGSDGTVGNGGPHGTAGPDGESSARPGPAKEKIGRHPELTVL